MTTASKLIRKTLTRTIPLELRSYLTPRPSIGLDPATWDREYAAGEWSKLSELHEMPRYAIVAGYNRAIGSAASVLDVGCGEGHLASWLFETGTRRYTGIDVSRVAIDKAQTSALNETRFEVADAVTFDPGEQFDMIVLKEVLYYIDRPEEVLDRYAGFLTPGGYLVISMYRVPESLNAWRRCAPRLEVLENVWLKGDKAEWNVWLCRPKRRPA
jgi:2-polyprenyl-3-methyl-5-hydroxy-6-metoxy-1,4-benzoquinol methylase